MPGVVNPYDPPEQTVPEQQAIQVMSPQFGGGSTTWRLLPTRWHGEFSGEIPLPRGQQNADWEVRPGFYERLSDGFTLPSSFPLTECIRAASNGQTIRVNGKIPAPPNRYVIGGGINGLSPWTGVSLVSLGAPLELTIIGANGDGSDEIPAIQLRDTVQDIGVPPNGPLSVGIGELRLQDLTIRNSNGANAPIEGAVGEEVGVIRILNCWLTGDASAPFGGFGMLHGIDCRTRARWDLRDVHIGWSPLNDPGVNLSTPGSRDYGVVVDSPKTNSAFLRCTMDRSWQGMFHVRQRGLENPGAVGDGILLFDRCVARNVWGDQEPILGHFHVEGHHGTVIFRECRSESGPAAQAGGEDRASILVAPPSSSGEWLTDANGFTTTRVAIIDHDVDLPIATQAHIRAHGVGTIQVSSLDFLGSIGAAVRNIDISPPGIGSALDFSPPTLQFVVSAPAQNVPAFSAQPTAYPGWNPTQWGLGAPTPVYYAGVAINVDAQGYAVIGDNFLFPGVAFNQTTGLVTGTPLEGDYDPPVAGVFWVGAFTGGGQTLDGELGAFGLTVEDFSGQVIQTFPTLTVNVTFNQANQILENQQPVPTLPVLVTLNPPGVGLTVVVPVMRVDVTLNAPSQEASFQQAVPTLPVDVTLNAPTQNTGQTFPTMTIRVTLAAPAQELLQVVPVMRILALLDPPRPNVAQVIPTLPVLVTLTPPQRVGGIIQTSPTLLVLVTLTPPLSQRFPTLLVLVTLTPAVPFARIFTDRVLSRGQVGNIRPKRVDVDR